MRPFVNAAVIFCILAMLLLGLSFVTAQQQPALTPGCSQTDTCKAAESANAAAANATSAATNAQLAAGAAQNATRSADESAKDAKDAADAATKAAADAKSAAKTATKSVRTTGSAANLGPLPRRATAKRAPIDDYVPCLFDDAEIRAMRALEPPDEPHEEPSAPKVKKGQPLDAEGAEAVLSAVQQVLTQAATPPAEVGKKPSKNKSLLLGDDGSSHS